MARQKPPEVSQGMAADDPRRRIKIRRLGEERARIAGFQAREPKLNDPDFEEWEKTVHSLLRELFGGGEFVLRFRQLRFRPINHYMGGHTEWYGDPKVSWDTSLQHADKILGEALEEAGVEFPPEQPSHSMRERAPNVVVTVQNQNIFSPNVHVSVTQLIQRLDALALSNAEKQIATEHLQDLQTEIEGQMRWPIIAKSLEAMKSIGKNVYKEIAVPLLVEFLKRESGLSSD